MIQTPASALGLAALTALAALSLVPPRATLAQQPAATTIARTFELRARPGLAGALDAGYRRHLDWHAGAGDRWGWYLWEITNGERAGLYVDGTFGHAWSDFDAAVDPSGDGADNEVNVEPFATRGANHVWRLRPELSGAAFEPDASPLVRHAEYHVRPGAEVAFTAALQRLRAAAGARPYAVYELVSGGAPGTYVMWAPARTWAELGALNEWVAEANRELAASADQARVELWRLRRDLSLCRDAAARCHRAVAAAPGVSTSPTR